MSRFLESILYCNDLEVKEFDLFDSWKFVIRIARLMIKIRRQREALAAFSCGADFLASRWRIIYDDDGANHRHRDDGGDNGIRPHNSNSIPARMVHTDTAMAHSTDRKNMAVLVLPR